MQRSQISSQGYETWDQVGEYKTEFQGSIGTERKILMKYVRETPWEFENNWEYENFNQRFVLYSYFLMRKSHQ